jgi:UDP-arabinose 4-epimerase
MMQPIMVTGGAGFIGSHASKQLSAAGFRPVVFDNLSTGHRSSVKWGPLVEGDILDTAAMVDALRWHNVKAIMHFAACAYVGESVTDPGKYYRNNVAGTLSVLNAARQAGIEAIVFSSSCATYGAPERLPITEDTLQAPINPYGRTKLIGEQMLCDYEAAYDLRHAILRYFNACGADPGGELGEFHDPETHLVPRAMMAAGGAIDCLDIFGTDYATADGTCVRDYIHVTDLANAHVAALRHLLAGGRSISLNLGAGKGTSIREIVTSIEATTGRRVPVAEKPRRAGDPPILIADNRLARETIGFEAPYSDIDTIIRTAAPFFGLRATS